MINNKLLLHYRIPNRNTIISGARIKFGTYETSTKDIDGNEIHDILENIKNINKDICINILTSTGVIAKQIIYKNITNYEFSNDYFDYAYNYEQDKNFDNFIILITASTVDEIYSENFN